MATRQPKEDPARWLLGTWRSDRDKTLREWVWPPGLRGTKLRRVLSGTFGRLTHRFTPKRAYFRFDSDSGARNYRVVWKNEDSVFLVLGPAEKDSMLIHFTGPDEFFVHCGRGIEYFARQRVT